MYIYIGTPEFNTRHVIISYRAALYSSGMLGHYYLYRQKDIAFSMEILLPRRQHIGTTS